MTALRACIDAGRNSSGSELFSTEGAATLDAYVEVLKSGLRYVGIICHGGGSFLVRRLQLERESERRYNAVGKKGTDTNSLSDIYYLLE